MANSLLYFLALDYNNEDDIVKRATTSHSHNIMRFGRAGHNIMHFGKRNEAANEDGMDNFGYTESMDATYYDPSLAFVGPRPLRAKYFIPHAFIASLYTHPRSFLKKAGANRDLGNSFMHFG